MKISIFYFGIILSLLLQSFFTPENIASSFSNPLFDQDFTNEKKLTIQREYPDNLNTRTVTFPTFPHTIDYDIDIVFIGFNQTSINTTFILQYLPKVSQISRYIPLSYLYETYINYSLNYRFVFMENAFASYFSSSMLPIGTFSFDLDFLTFWVNRTSIGYYKRISPSSVKEQISTKINDYKTQDGHQPNINYNSPTIFISNLFFHGSEYYQNNTAIPHTYPLDKKDTDTNAMSDLRKEAYFAPSLDWTDKRWLFFDISSGPCSYESILSEYTNYIDYILTSKNMGDLFEEWGRFIRAAVFSRFVPTYLYEPIWSQKVEFRVALFHDQDFSGNDYLKQNLISQLYENFLPFSDVSFDFKLISCTDGSDLYNFLDSIDHYTEYSTWCTKLIDDFLLYNENNIFGPPPSTDTIRFLIGIINSDRISGHEDSLGFTYGAFGSPRPTGSVITISPSTVNNKKEGLTQTTIHEIGHLLSLRHPHDYRFNDQLYKLWSLDTCTTPLNYMFPVYDWHIFEKDTLYRGQYRYLYNETVSVKNEIDIVLEQKNFPEKTYPFNIYTSLENISTLISNSITQFKNKEYLDSLNGIINCYNNLLSIYMNVSLLSNYFSPAVNFSTENNSYFDYGDNIVISGSIVTYSEPEGYVYRASYLDNLTFAQISYEPNLYSSNFYSVISGTEYGDLDATTKISIRFCDGIRWYSYSIFLTFRSLSIDIISPSNNMDIDMSFSGNIKIVGSYFSVSNNSEILLIYGSEVYVHDYSDNSSYWISVGKTSGNEWIYHANCSNFINGINTVKVQITNGVINEYDIIKLNINGLPEKINADLTEETTTGNLNTSSSVSMPNRFDTLVFMALIAILSSGGFISIKIINFYRKKRLLRNPTELLPSFPKRVEELKDTIDKKSKLIEETTQKSGILKKSNSKEFKIKRRRQ